MNTVLRTSWRPRNLLLLFMTFMSCVFIGTLIGASCEGPKPSDDNIKDSVDLNIEEFGHKFDTIVIIKCDTVHLTKIDTVTIYFDLNADRYPAELSKAINQIAAQEEIIEALTNFIDYQSEMKESYRRHLEQAAASIRWKDEQLKRCVIDGRIKQDTTK